MTSQNQCITYLRLNQSTYRTDNILQSSYHTRKQKMNKKGSRKTKSPSLLLRFILKITKQYNNHLNATLAALTASLAASFLHHQPHHMTDKHTCTYLL